MMKTEKSKDFISRADAIEAVFAVSRRVPTMAIRAKYALESLPSASVEVGEWIPVSERLPSENGRYLVTYPLFIQKNKWLDIMHFGKPSMPNIKVKGKCWYRADEEWGDVVYDDILAWMPLPKPYTQESEVEG